jgi:hypothetical protein
MERLPLKETKFYLVLPQTDPSLVSREGIVEFIDQDQPYFTILVQSRSTKATLQVSSIAKYNW